MWDQVVVGAAPGDAITTNALLLQSRLRLLGPSQIHAEHVEPGLAGRIHRLDDLPDRPNTDRPLVFHASMGSWPVYRALQPERRLILVYHNFSPPDPYVSFAPHVASDLTRGRWELEQIRDRVVLAIADSEFNAEELRELGYEDVQVIAPTPNIDRLRDIRPDPAMLARISSWGPGPVVLCIAQQLPHKRIERVMTAMAILQQEYLPHARLAYVGVERFHQYAAALRSHASSVGLRETHMLGRVTDAELAALYLRASAFLTLSDHEGFCVPAVEAMALGVPVIASDRAALPDTIGDAGIIMDPENLVGVAATLRRVLVDEELRRILIGRGMSRARSLDASHSLPQLVDAVCGTDPTIVGDIADRMAITLAAP